jgi:RNA polymerase sigma-70 factor (ECF subfamily)
MPTGGSFADVLRRLETGDDRAASLVVRRFAQRLVALARSRLDTVLRRKVEPEDLVQSVFRTFFHRCLDGHFDLGSWQDLWSLLAVITVRKCVNKAEYLRAECRDPARENAGPPAARGAAGWDVVDREPTPPEAAMLAETVTELLRGLEPADREVVELTLHGYTVIEIAERLGRAERTVWRVRGRLRRRLQRLLTESAAE